jgi:TP901 family phage tail tape measure protein
MAESTLGRIKVVLNADTSNLVAGMSRASTKLSDFGDKATRVGRTLTTRVTLPMVGLAAAAVKTASDFESSMTKITALVGVARDEVDRMAVSVRGMATQFGKSANEAADALFYITSAGLRGATATDTLAASLKASAIGLGETSTIADLATSALNAYGADVLSAAQATDVMTATIREGKLETTELAGSMGRVLPLASAMGVNFNEVGAAFAALSRTGTNAAEAATQIRGILASLLRPTKQAEEALTEMGLSSEGLRRQMREEGLLATLKTLSEQFAGNEAAAAAVFGNIRALSGVLDLMGANAATTDAIFGAMEDTTGAVDEAFAAVAETTAFQFQQAMAEVKELLLSMGQSILPQVNDALQFVAEGVRTVADFFRGLSPELQGSIKALAGIAAAAGPAALGIGMVSKALVGLMGMTPMTAGLTLAFVALGGAVAAMYAEAKEARERAADLRDELTQLEDRLTTVVPKFQELVDTLAEQFPASPVEALTDELDNLAGRATLDAAIIESDLSDAFNAVGFDMGTLMRSLQAGGTSFEDFADKLPQAREQLEMVKSEFRQQNLEAMSLQGELDVLSQVMETLLGRALSDNERRLLEHATAMGYDESQVNDLAKELENLQTAFQSNIDTTEADAKAALTNADNLAVLNRALGDASVELIEKYKAEARALGITEQYTYAADKLSEVLGYQSQAAQEAAWFTWDLADVQYEVAESTDLAGESMVALAQNLLDAGNNAGYDIVQTRDLIKQLGILDQLDPQVVIDLGLDVTGAAQSLTIINRFIEAQRDALIAAGEGRFIMRALGPLIALRDALQDTLDGPEDKDTKGRSPASTAMDELARAEEEAAREAERLQAEIDRVAERIAGLGTELVGKDFFEFLLGASADEIEDRFYDIGQAAMVLVDQAEALGLAGGPQFLQTLANIGTQFDQLAELQRRVAATQDKVAAAESRLADATSDLATAQANLNRENERYAEFLYGEGAGGGTFEQVLRTEIGVYRDLQRELSGLESSQAGFRQRIIDMMSPTVAGAAGAGGVMGNLGNILAQARAFRNNLIELRDRGYPTDVIGQVVAAGMTQGNIISRRLLALGTSEFEEFLALRDEIGRIGVETAAIAGEVIFGADIAEAQGAVGEQFAVVDAMFQSAIAQAEANVREQAAVVDRLQSALAALETRLQDLRDGIQTLAADIQTSMRAAFDQFLAGLNAAISRLPEVRNLPAPTSSGGGGGGGGGGGAAAGPAPAPAPAPSAPSGYSVQRGDSLWAIAARELGSGARWREIQAANNISGTLIHPGQVLTIPGRARGGPVSGGRPYLVGERGPELFVPSESGTIVSNGQTQAMAGKGAVYNINVHAYGDPAEAGRQIVKAIQEWERRNGSNWRS